jgi:hypothetical protein
MITRLLDIKLESEEGGTSSSGTKSNKSLLLNRSPRRPWNRFRSIYLRLSPHLFWNKKRKYGADESTGPMGALFDTFSPMQIMLDRHNLHSASPPTSRPMSRERSAAIDPVVISKFNTLHSPCFEWGQVLQQSTNAQNRADTHDRPLRCTN